MNEWPAKLSAMRKRLAWVLILSAFGSVSSPAQRPPGSDSTLQGIQYKYDAGSYLNAELEARRYLEGAPLSDSARIVAEQLIAFSLVAQDKAMAAANHFAIILALDSSYVLDPVLTSPKIRQAFEAAHQQYHHEERKTQVWRSGGTPAEISSPSFRLLVFPGWDQLHQGKTTKGTLLLTAGVLTLASSVTFDLLRRSAREDYLAAETPADAAAQYTTYDRYAKAEYYCVVAFALVYLYSAFDALLDVSPPFEAAVSATPTGPALSVRWTL